MGASCMEDRVLPIFCVWVPYFLPVLLPWQFQAAVASGLRAPSFFVDLMFVVLLVILVQVYLDCQFPVCKGYFFLYSGCFPLYI